MSAVLLDPCTSTDGAGCFWDAGVHGDVVGQSFFEFDGITVVIEVPDGFFIESVRVDDEHFFVPGYASGPGYGVTFGQADAPEPTATTVAAVPVDEPLPATGLDLTVPLVVVGAAVLVFLVGVGLAWIGRAR